MMKGPAPDRPADGRQRPRTGRRHEAMRGDTSLPHRLPRSKHKTEEVERLIWEITTAVRILAVDDLRLLGMQHQLAGRKAVSKHAPQRLRFLSALTMTNSVIRVSLERDVREHSRHPHVERIM